jgi:ABC-type amino acid transport substrate-binding protein
MNKLGITLLSVFLCLVAFYLLILKPEKYEEIDIYDSIMEKGIIRVGINIDSKPFGFRNEKGEICGYDADLARYIAEHITGNRNNVKFIPVTPHDRLLKASTGDVDIIMATMTITPQREQIIEFSIPYDIAGQALLVKNTSKITSIGDLSGQNVGVIWGTTAEKNMLNLAPTANIVGFKTYKEAYNALKNGKIEAITSDDTILSRFALEDKNVKLLPKRYSREPYGIGFRKGKSSAKLKNALNEAISNLKQKNVINRLHKQWLGL